MRILLCSATSFEIQPFLDKNSWPAAGLLITGVGLTAASFALTRKLMENKPDLVVQAGFAGSLDPQFKPGEVVAVSSDTIGDLGVEENGAFRSIADLNLLDANSAPWKNGELKNEWEELPFFGLPLVKAVTVNEISTDPSRIQYYRDHLNVQVETMEGAALHYVALQLNIPFLQVRSLSNFIGERDKSRWHLEEAMASLNSQLEIIIHKISNK